MAAESETNCVAMWYIRGGKHDLRGVTALQRPYQDTNTFKYVYTCLYVAFLGENTMYEESLHFSDHVKIQIPLNMISENFLLVLESKIREEN